MFKLVSKVISYTWGVVHSPNNEILDLSDDDEDTNANNPLEQKNIHGTITEINKLERFGVIDQNIFFSFDKVFGAKYPKVGDKVNAEISRDTPEQNWTAVNVTLVDEIWEVDGREEYSKDHLKSYSAVVNSENSTKKVIITTVKSISNLGVVRTRDGVEFNFKNIPSDFTPRPGDVLCLTCLVDKDYGDESQIIDFKPTRSGKVEGEITLCRAEDGVINDEVWFSKAACDRNYCPRKGDKVVAQTVESNKGKYIWRATNVTPTQVRTLDRSNKPKIVPRMVLPVQRSFIQELLKEKNNVSVTDNLTFGQLEINNKTYLTVWIANNGTSDVKLLNCRFKISPETTNHFTVNKAALYRGNSNISAEEDETDFVIIPPGGKAYVNVVCNSICIGKSRNLLFLEFETFSIGRYVDSEVIVEIQNALLPSLPFQHKTKEDCSRQREIFDKNANNFVISGVLPFKPPSNVPVKLGMYLVPKILWNAIMDNDDEELFKLLPFLAEDLTKDNYSDRFSALLHLEEIQQTLDMRRYDMRDVCLTRAGEFIKLNVPGLAEGRPSLLVGDTVMLTNPGEDNNGPVYTGFIHETLRSDVLIKFNPTFHSKYGGESYNVAFQFSRTSFRRFHQAVNQIYHIDREIIFPTKCLAKSPVVSFMIEDEATENQVLKSILLKLKTKNGAIENGIKTNSAETQCWFNKSLNERQRSAVKRIVENQSRPLPYIIFGPPGTGKTVTLVEAILQVFRLVKKSRILIVAPSNSAADLITVRLHDSGHLNESNLARLISFSRFKQEEMIPEKILKYCKKTDYDSISNVAYFRIIVSTCSTIGSLYTLGLNVKHFTHAFIDEAGQATEPESMVIVGLVAAGNGQVVLAGDHKQLGPVLRSVRAKAYGLEYSMLERIMERFPYQRDEARFSDHGNYDPFLVTKLVKNYRSHDSILKVYSTLFYNEELISLANKEVVNLFENWEGLPKANFPLIFNGVRGENYREDTSPSWFNPTEVVQVIRYLSCLYNLGISPEDIGIITPYKKQVEKIRFLMKSLEMEPCKVGSVEEFQGQEFLVIIISTVRTCPDLLEYDTTHNLGFLGNPKRFNVAVSRAMALLIVIGDPYLLSKDENWGYLLRYCIKNGSYDGTEFNEL